MSHYRVSVSPQAQLDLERLYEFWLNIDEVVAQRAIDTVVSGYAHLERSPFACRKAANGTLGPLWRELLISFGSSGYVALFEIVDDQTVLIAAVRHQRESDYH